MKRKIERLKAQPHPESSVDLRPKILKDVLKGVIFSAITLKNDIIYRARWNQQLRLFENVSELIYPPPEYATRGRFNEQGESIFYGAACEFGTIIELRPEIGKLFTISRFARKHAEDPLFFPLAIRDKDGERDRYLTPRKRSHKVLHDFLYENLTSRGNDPRIYDLSIMLGRNFFDASVDLPQGSRYAGIAYASVESRLISSHLTYNCAMKPVFFDQNYNFSETYVYGLTLEKNHYQLNPVNHATSGTSGNLNWRYSYQEMVERLSRGVLLDDKICAGMAAAIA